MADDDQSQLTPQQIEALAAPDDSSSTPALDPMDTAAYFGNPHLQGSKGRQASASSNKQASMMPVSLARGAVAGTVGTPGDVESLIRSAINNYQGESGEQGPGVSPDTALPTTADLNKSLPLKTEGGMNDMATGVGNVAAPFVASEALKGSTALAKYLGPTLDDMVHSHIQNIGGELNAVKEPGGNWSSLPGNNLDRTLENIQGNAFDPQSKQWVDTKLRKYIKNDLGTANDPLAGAPHLTPDLLNGKAQSYAVGDEYNAAAPPTEYTGGVFSDPNNSTQVALTGRNSRTPWEQVSDNQLHVQAPEDYVNRLKQDGHPVPPWLTGPNAKPVTDILDEGFAPGELGFDHMIDYLNSALRAGSTVATYGHDAALTAGGVEGRADADLIARNLHILPSDLQKMSVQDVANKTGSWNDYLQAKKDNAATQLSPNSTVTKQYPDGHQWVQLAPEDLQGEGDSMGHCVGGYCDSVKDGSSTIYSLRDSQGKPHVTVETRPGADKTNIVQIKGKGNAAPVDAYQPHVQDLVQNMGPWGDIGDLGNTGLVDANNLTSGMLHKQIYNARPDLLPDDRDIAIQGIKEELKANPPTTRYIQKTDLDKLMAPYLPPRNNVPKFAVGGSIDAPATVGLATFAGQNGGPQASTGTSSGGQSGDPTGYMQSAPTPAPAVAAAGPGPAAGAGNTPTDGSNWNFDANGNLINNASSAPTYNDPFTTFMGEKMLMPGANYDPVLAETLNAGGAGNMKYGAAAFLNPSSNTNMGGIGQAADMTQNPNGSQSGADFATSDMVNLAKNMHIDLSGANGDPQQMESILNDKLSGYSAISGMSEGWNPTSDVRGSNTVLYQSQNGKLVPIQQGGNYSAPTDGGFLADHYGILAPLAVVGGGLAFGAMAGAGAGAAAGGASAGADAGATAGVAGGTAGTGAGVSEGLGSGLSSFWGGLSPIEQSALTGAAKGGISSAVQGQNPLTGALEGGVTGGLGAWAGPAISGLTGLGSNYASALGSAGIGAGTAALNGNNPWMAALMSGGTSLGTSALTSAGVPSSVAGPAVSQLAKYFTTPGNTAAATPQTVAAAPAAAAPATVASNQPSYASLGSYFTTPAKRAT